ncbi:dihydrofolate reductase family protein [Herbiconiux sp. KACC 21604]|uniref:dihydrofolate reductase family protein n=1 Tax=unclassified Herbiconiux TaxID=2618217 RepID=UPI001492F981|nr:dihydrofolate reductase family protein [Herbiconiux sp. SALV-R1]QJU53649.1 dihydrofolate reductase [Herbiconiux sp. SALV-R1]WPO88634.1 dihydrofolate reductase family protein [Herbiconiux sp. KACC 21604]
MTKTQYYVAASVDGFIADRENGLGWLLEFGMEEFESDYEEFLGGVGVVVMGSRTYEWLLAEGSPWAYPEQEAWVLTSRELPPIEHGERIRFAAGDVTALHREWVEAAGGKNIWVVGGGEVAAQVADAGLLDELLLTIMPVALGDGAPLLPIAANTPALKASNVVALPSGAISVRYALRAG